MVFKPDVYAKSGVYDEVLPPFFFKNLEGKLVLEEELLEQRLKEFFGAPHKDLNMLEIGAGTGRMTELIVPYAKTYTATDKYQTMLDVLQTKITTLRLLNVNTINLKTQLPSSQKFDFVGTYWTLSYPVVDCLEMMYEGKIIPNPNFEEGVAKAKDVIASLVDYLDPQKGVFHTFLFDSESVEQKAVTKIWEQVAPFPGGRRSFTREVIEAALADAARAKGYRSSIIHHTGKARLVDEAALRNWFGVCHARNMDALTKTELFEKTIEHLVDVYSNPDGSVDIPVGMYEYIIRTA